MCVLYREPARGSSGYGDAWGARDPWAEGR